MILSTKIVIPYKLVNKMQTGTSISNWCNSHLGDHRVFWLSDNLSKTIWNQESVEMAIIFDTVEDKVLFDLTWNELL